MRGYDKTVVYVCKMCLGLYKEAYMFFLFFLFFLLQQCNKVVLLDFTKEKRAASADQ